MRESYDHCCCLSVKDTLQEVNHIPGFVVYFKILLAEQLSFKQHRMKNGSELD